MHFLVVCWIYTFDWCITFWHSNRRNKIFAVYICWTMSATDRFIWIFLNLIVDKATEVRRIILNSGTEVDCNYLPQTIFVITSTQNKYMIFLNIKGWIKKIYYRACNVEYHEQECVLTCNVDDERHWPLKCIETVVRIQHTWTTDMAQHGVAHFSRWVSGGVRHSVTFARWFSPFTQRTQVKLQHATHSIINSKRAQWMSSQRKISKIEQHN